jgi:hypothetical protein
MDRERAVPREERGDARGILAAPREKTWLATFMSNIPLLLPFFRQ